MVYHKGERCVHNCAILCQEGYCSECNISDLAGRMFIVKPVLTDRQIQILQGIAEGLTHKQIGLQMGISVHTVENHLTYIRRKLGIKSTVQILTRCLQAGLLK